MYQHLVCVKLHSLMAVTGNSEVMTGISHSMVNEQPDNETFDREMHIPWMNILY